MLAIFDEITAACRGGIAEPGLALGQWTMSEGIAPKRAMAGKCTRRGSEVMMEVGTLAVSATAALAPYLPYLVKASEAAAGEAGKKLTGGGWELAKGLWAKLHPAVEAGPAAQEAARDAAAAPDDGDAQEVFRVQVRKLLEMDPELAVELAAMLEKAERSGQSVIVHGDSIGAPITVGQGNQVSVGNVKVGERPVPKA
jgi:hypothetical protein